MSKDQRIRYVKTSTEGIVKSYKYLRSSKNDALYEVELDLNKVTFRITNKTNRRIFTGGEGVNNLHVLKRNVKKRLGELGVVFGSEVRDASKRVIGKNCAYGKSEG